MKLNGRALYDIWQALLFGRELGIDGDAILSDYFGLYEVNQ